ncbi:MAG: Qnr family pentapeptide repeat protein [Stenotrophomonas nitritireducens]|uniref:Qnr family pentapeptide repeat protein n=1 Tax=Stenotrophomonas nitritireducens TaxID=83617 RepID=UPI001AC7B6C5|nr:Qnr family pentapeptide repeat protein [Stenotrophomonas nitritireducens]MBN8791785.1 Qnr family pentapeptide repeat protein [Stenotrophomonas nitritireducens]MBN8795723.1 Qnr family pentapeptide repeat protein [Stenotrophomonas nitritireducens]
MSAGAAAAPTIVSNERIDKDRFTGARVASTHFLNCDFSGADLTGAEFVNCVFYDAGTQAGCRFNGAQLKEASFRQCDLSLCRFAFAKALGLEIVGCRAQGADFSNASFMNQITARTWFCSAFIKQSNLSYADFSGVALEKCELSENRWVGANVAGANFSGSDMSGGDFSSLDWRSADFTHCDLTGSELGDLDLRAVDLEGASLDTLQVAQLMLRMGITVEPLKS